MKKNYYRPAIRLILVGLAGALLVACNADSNTSVANSNQPGGGTGDQHQCRGYNAERNVYFGDLHVHTTYSLDANTQGTRLAPRDAYRFAKGERLGIQPYAADGTPLRYRQLDRPLDFAAVTDHAELFGEVQICTTPGKPGYNSPLCLFYRNSPKESFTVFNLLQLGPPDLSRLPISALPLISGLPLVGADGVIPRLPFCGLDGQRCRDAAKTPWLDIQAQAEAFYDRSADCSFTTFVGYEWTGSPLSNNLHRNVIFKTASVPGLPVVYQEFPEPELLWDELDKRCRPEDGCNYLTIPHNSNLSAGLMFKNQDKNGDPYTAEFAARRRHNEPLAEIYQHKGSSECNNKTGAGAQDELCGFELIPYNNLTGDRFGGFNTGPPKKRDFLREALKDGLRLQQILGENPYKYGFIAGTDTHIGTPGQVSESNFPGHGGAGKPAIDEIPPGLSDLVENSPGGLAAVWAEENTRDSIYTALRRREVYGTSGPRMRVRFFGGFDVSPNQCDAPDFAASGYAHGVPMGGDLPAAPAGGAAPRFAVAALRDPAASAQPLQRIQIIKGWVDENNQKHEQVYDVAGNPVSSASVDLSTCETSGPGFGQLCSVWQDPDFNPAQPSFYYSRVVENPSCRWSQRQCVAAKVDCSDPGSVPDEYKVCCRANVPKTIQERAWSSPIWYTPPAGG